MENLILYDWFAMTCKSDSVDSILEMLEFKDPESIKWREDYGFYGYRSRLHFDGMSIYFNHCRSEQDYPMIEFSGQGCRDFETYSNCSWERLFACALDTENYNVTRLDVAYDDHTGILDINKILKLTYDGCYVSRSQKGIHTSTFSSDKVSRSVKHAHSIMYGSKSSEFYIRIYDKAAERGGLNEHWIRCESVFKHERAFNFIGFIMSGESVGKTYCSVLNNYLRFVRPDQNDSNKNRWKTQKFWTDFLGEVEKISLTTKKDVEYNLHKIERYVFNQSGNSIETIINCIGVDEFMHNLMRRRSELNVHQRRIIDEYKRAMKEQRDYR